MDALGNTGKERWRCQHCSHARDTAHTRAVCTAWAVERAALVTAVGQDLSLSAIVKAAVTEEENWRAFFTFCEQVMRQKEEREREREKEGRRERIGGRGRWRGG